MLRTAEGLLHTAEVCLESPASAQPHPKGRHFTGVQVTSHDGGDGLLKQCSPDENRSGEVDMCPLTWHRNAPVEEKPRL